MALTPGTRLGVYQIVGAVGAGGMGEVYRATDTKLKRDVAIKVLPASLADDPERLARFQREAEVLASLNHPNIAQIYGLEESDGLEALVMELIEGPTLAESIAQRAAPGSGLQVSRREAKASSARATRGLPLDEALTIALQIAGALEAAHEQGIIHRDLKPANVKVTPDGVVKVLDFGLAKALEPPRSEADVAASPTLSMSAAATRAGMVLGTTAYMSPEQARGKPVDTRTDVWAFGCVLYEMLTGRRPFPGDEILDTLAAIVGKEPDWTVLPADVPPRVRRVIELCLEKSVKERLAHVQDVRLALGGAFETTSALPERPPGPPPSGWRRPVVVGPAAAGLALFVAGLAAWSLRPAPVPLQVTRAAIASVDHPVLLSDNPVVALSPDGRLAVYRAGMDGGAALVARSLDSLETRVLYAGALNAGFTPFFSPDGAWVAFKDQAAYAMKRVASSGGPALTITAMGTDRLVGATWDVDDTIIFGDGDTSGLWRVPVTGGSPERLTSLNEGEGEVNHEWPELLPGGRGLLFTIRYRAPVARAAEAAGESSSIAVLEPGGMRHKVVVPGGSAARYVPTGHLVYGYAGTLRAVPFDLERLESPGAPVTVVENVTTRNETGAANFAIAQNGSLLYVKGGGDSSTAGTPVWVDRAGVAAPIEGIPSGPYSGLQLAPDGTRFLTVVDGNLWVYEIANGRRTALTTDGRTLPYIVWSPDGSTVAYTSSRSGTQDVWIQSADGHGDPELVTAAEGGNDVHVDSWSPDGSLLAIHRHLSSGTDSLVVRLDADDRSPQPMFAASAPSESEAQFSPDGRYVAYVSSRTGRREIEVRPVSGSGARVTVSVDGGVEPLWSRSGDLLFRHPVSSAMMRARVSTEPTLRVSTPETLFDASRFGHAVIGESPRARYDVTADGQRLLMLRREEQQGDSAIPQLILVQNWFEELTRLVPPGR